MIQKVLILIILLVSGGSIAFFNSWSGLLSLTIVTTILTFKTSVSNVNKKLLISCSVWFGYFVISTITTDNDFHGQFLTLTLFKIIIAHNTIQYVKFNLFEIYAKVMYFLVVFSLVFYSLHILIPETLYNLLSQFDLSEGLFEGKRKYASIAFYTFHEEYNMIGFPRNSGFCWEPGPFGLFIIFALYFEIITNNLEIFSKRGLIYVFAIITTQSTTALLALFLLLLWYNNYMSISKLRYFKLLFTSIFLFLSLSYFPLFSNKISNEYQQDYNELLYNAQKYDRSYNPGRFASLKLSFQDYLNYPIAGTAGSDKLKVGYVNEDTIVSSVGGNAEIMGKHGSIGILIFILILTKWIKFFNHNFKGRHQIIMGLVLISGFGFSIILSPIFFCFYLSPIYFSTKNSSEQNHNENIINK